MTAADPVPEGPKRQLMLTFSNPADPGVETEYHRWYTRVHIPQLLDHIPGMRSASRYRCGGDAPAHRYLVVFEVEGEEEEIRQAIAARIGDGTLERSPALQRDPPPVMVFVDPIDDRGNPLEPPSAGDEGGAGTGGSGDHV